MSLSLGYYSGTRDLNCVGYNDALATLKSLEKGCEDDQLKNTVNFFKCLPVSLPFPPEIASLMKDVINGS